MADAPNKEQLEKALEMAYRQGKIDQDHLYEMRSHGEEGESPEFLENEAVKTAYKFLRNLQNKRVNDDRRGAQKDS